MTYNDLFFRIHAIERMLEQDIDEVEVRDVLENGEVIEEAMDQFGARKLLQSPRCGRAAAARSDNRRRWSPSNRGHHSIRA